MLQLCLNRQTAFQMVRNEQALHEKASRKRQVVSWVSPCPSPTSELQEGTSACFSSTFTECYNLAGHSLVSGSRLALIIQAQESCEGGMRCLHCRPRNSEVYLSMSKCLRRMVLLLLQSCLLLPTAWDWSTSFSHPPLPLFSFSMQRPCNKTFSVRRKGNSLLHRNYKPTDDLHLGGTAAAFHQPGNVA